MKQAAFPDISSVPNVHRPAARLALGTVQFGLSYGVANTVGQVSLAEVRAILQTGRAGGIDTLDTAIAYGSSEAALGAQGVEGWKVVTKLPALPPDAKDAREVHAWVLEQARASLARLGLERVDAVLLHRPDQLLDPRGSALAGALQELKELGWTAKIGVSIYQPEELEVLTQICPLDLVQAPLNILDRSLVTSGWAARLKSQGTEIHVRSAFLQGLLLMETGERPAKFERWQPLWQQWREWLDLHGLTPLEACLRYAMSVPEVDKVVVGVETARQLSEIMEAARGALPPPPEWVVPVDADLVNPARWSQI